MAKFRRATRSKVKIRMSISGPSGSGKTFTAACIAAGIAPGGRIAVIDTESGSAAKSIPRRIEFDTLELGKFHPANYIEAIHDAESEGFDVIIIDSLSHAWFGPGGELELVDQAARKTKSGNTFAAWKDVTPLHNALIQALISSSCHVIATMRSQTEYVLEVDGRTGKQAPRKVGTKPVMRDGMDYEFDIAAEMDLDHNFIISKARALYSGLESVTKEPDEKFGQRIAAMANDAPDAPQAVGTKSDTQPDASHRTAVGLVDPETTNRLAAAGVDLNLNEQQWTAILAKRGASSLSQLSQEAAADLLGKLQEKISQLTEEAVEHNRQRHEFGERLDASHAARPKEVAAQ